MIITCPRCETSFSLPEELYKPGKKARCSNCGFIFPMPAQGRAQPSGEPAQNSAAIPSIEAKAPALKKKRPYLFALLAIPLLALLAYGAYLMTNSFSSFPFSGPGQKSGTSSEPAQTVEGKKPPADPVKEAQQTEQERLINSITLEEIRQFLVDNSEMGKLMVIQGFAVNKGEKNRDYISVEVRILDSENKVLASAQQICGVPLTLFQLQTLSEKDLRETLANRTTILVNNTNVPPGGKVPFVVVFPNPTDSMRTFEVQVVGVRESPPS